MSDEKVTHALDMIDELLKLGANFEPGGLFGPITDNNQLDKFVQSKSPEKRELFQEYRNFDRLLSFITEKKLNVGEPLLSQLESLRHLPLRQRINRMREINQTLFRKVKEEHEATQCRQ